MNLYCRKSDESIHFRIIAKTSDKTTKVDVQENEEQCKQAPQMIFFIHMAHSVIQILYQEDKPTVQGQVLKICSLSILTIQTNGRL